MNRKFRLSLSGIAVGVLTAIIGIAIFFALTFALIYYGLVGFAPGFSSTNSGILVPYFHFPVLFLLIFAGYLTARVAGSSEIIHSAVTGILLSLIWFFIDKGDSELLIYLTVVVPCAIGGFWQRFRIAKNNNDSKQST